MQWQFSSSTTLGQPFALQRGVEVKGFGLSFTLVSHAHSQLLDQQVSRHNGVPSSCPARELMEHGPFPCMNLPRPLALLILECVSGAFPTPMQMVVSLGLKAHVRWAPIAPPTPLAHADSGDDVAVEPSSLTNKCRAQGAVHTEFQAEVVLAALQLSHLMKPSANMRDVVIAACRMVLDPDSLQDIKRKFDSGNLAVPVYDTLRRWWVKFDCLATLYQRQVDLSSDIVRCLLMDSSPIAGWNYLCSKSLEFRFAKGMTHSARMEACLVTAYQSRRLPVMVLGHGASSVTVKVAELVHIMKMETGTIAAFNLWRWSVRHF